MPGDAAGVPPPPGDLPPVGDMPAEPTAKNLPFAYAYAEAPPQPKGKVSGKQRKLMAQLFKDTPVIKRIFGGTGTKLKGPGKKLMGDLAKLLKAVPDLALVFEVHVDAGSVSKSQALADQRAAALEKEFMKKAPDAQGRVFFRGLGNSQPLAKAVNKRARKQNTRVEVRRVYPK